MISITTKIEKKGDADSFLKKILRAIGIGGGGSSATASPSMVKVGFPAGRAPASIINIAFWNHEGTSRKKGDVFFRNGKFGISGPIPARPFITVAMFKGRGAVRQQLRTEAAKIMRGEQTMPVALQRLGIQGQNLIQAQISAGMGPANSPMTIALKGSSKPLIDTGAMRTSVTWAIDQ